MRRGRTTRSDDADGSPRAALCRTRGGSREAAYARTGARPRSAGLMARDRPHRRRDAPPRLRPEPRELPAGLASDVPPSESRAAPVGWSGDHVVADTLAGGPRGGVAGLEHAVR